MHAVRVATLMLVVTSIAMGCGESQPEARSEPKSRFDAGQCRDQIGAFIDALAEIDSRLSVGMDITEMSGHLGDARVAYDGIDVDAIEPKCAKYGAKGEDAFNAYITAMNAWQACIDNLTSDDCGGSSRVQDNWSKASRLLQQIDSGLEE